MEVVLHVACDVIAKNQGVKVKLAKKSCPFGLTSSHADSGEHCCRKQKLL